MLAVMAAGKGQARLRTKSAVLCLFSCLLILVLSTLAASSEKRMKPLSREELSRTWIGLSEDELYLVRLRLDSSGAGQVGYLFGEELPRIFRVRSWTCDGDQISIPLAPMNEASLEVPTLSGAVIGASMKLSMKGSGWSRRVELRLEDSLEQRWSKLKKEMARNVE